MLNSPWFDLQGPAILRTRVTSTAIGAMSRVRKTRVVRGTGKGGYGLTLHRDYHGEFEYNLQWKPLGGFPVTFGWIHAVRRGQATLHRGLDVGVPNLILRSDHSVPETTNPDTMQRGDAVLDVTQIARWAGCIGNRTTVVPIPDAKHDVFLSLAEPGPRPSGSWAAGWISISPISIRWLRGQDEESCGAFRHRHHRNRFGQHDSRRALRREEGGDLRAGRVRRHLPQCGLHPDQDVRLRRRGGPDGAGLGPVRGDAHIDGVRWSDIVSRVFGRIDPLAAGGEHYRRSSPT